MNRIKSTDDLAKLRKSLESDYIINGRKIRLCAGGGCLASGEPELKTALKRALADAGISGQVAIKETGCLGPLFPRTGYDRGSRRNHLRRTHSKRCRTDRERTSG